jgi:hypothetical protein
MFRKLAPLLVVPLLLVTACANEADDGDGAVQVATGDAAVTLLRRAPEAAATAGTGRFEMVMRLTAVPGAAADVVSMAATGAFDVETQQMAMEIDLSALMEWRAEATGEALPAGLAEPARYVIDRGTVYVRMPMLDAVTGTTGWFSMTPEDVGVSTASLGLGSGTFDPTKMLEVLRGTTDGVEEVGQEEVRGVATTKYTATIDMVDALESFPADQREALEAQLDQLGARDAEVPVEVWVDADGLPRRFALLLDDFAAAPSYEAGMTMTIDLFDYGEPVDIEVPSPDEVTPFGDVLGGFGSAFGEAGA